MNVVSISLCLSRSFCLLLLNGVSFSFFSPIYNLFLPLILLCTNPSCHFHSISLFSFFPHISLSFSCLFSILYYLSLPPDSPVSGYVLCLHQCPQVLFLLNPYSQALLAYTLPKLPYLSFHDSIQATILTRSTADMHNRTSASSR